MAGWHHWLDGRESEWTLGVGDRQGGLACCDSWGLKESDMTEWLNWTDTPTCNAKEAAVEQLYEDLQGLLKLTPQKDILFIIGDWNSKVESQEIPGVTGKFGLGVQNEAGQRVMEFCQENTLIVANTFFQQQKRRLYTWTSSDGQYWKQIYWFFEAKYGEALCSQQ